MPASPEHVPHPGPLRFLEPRRTDRTKNLPSGFDSHRGYVTRNKHNREDTVTRDAKGDVVNMRGTITEASHARPYAPNHTEPKHAKD